MPITGGCLCKKVRYEIAADKPLGARVCWCRVCQYLSAGGGTVNAVFRKDAVTVTARNVGLYVDRRQRLGDASHLLPRLRHAAVQRGRAAPASDHRARRHARRPGTRQARRRDLDALGAPMGVLRSGAAANRGTAGAGEIARRRPSSRRPLNSPAIVCKLRAFAHREANEEAPAMSLSIYQSSGSRLRSRAERLLGDSRQGGGARGGAQVRSFRLSHDAPAPGHAGVRAPGRRSSATTPRTAPRGSPAFEAPVFEDDEASLRRAQGAHQKDAGFPRRRSTPRRSTRAPSARSSSPSGPNKMKMQGANYLLHCALPNFYFHLTTAYDILRYAGVDIGKRDFLGAVPGIAPA